MIPPDGFRLLLIGEFVPSTALWLSADGTWKETPAAGQKHTLDDNVVYVCPIGTPGTRIGSETVSDYPGTPYPGED